MKIVKNTFVDKKGAYYESGGLIDGTNRIISSNNIEYWQQYNCELTLAKKFDKNDNNIVKIDSAIYVGKIPQHFGHFLLEGLPRLCEIHSIQEPIIGYIFNNVLEDKTKRVLPIDDIKWVINKNDFLEIEEDTTFFVKNLFVPKLPFHLSHSCSEPWRMTSLIETIVNRARNYAENDFCFPKMDILYLSREEEYGINSYMSNPKEHIALQIAKISYAKMLEGQIGSSTHASIFAHQNCQSNFSSRTESFETRRNQAICDMIRSYNNFEYHYKPKTRSVTMF